MTGFDSAATSLKLKSIFGFRRTTLNQTSSVMHNQDTLRTPRIEPAKNTNKDLNLTMSNFTSVKETSPRASLPEIIKGSRNNRSTSVHLSGQSRFNREPIPLEAIIQMEAASIKTGHASRTSSKKNNIIKSNRDSVIKNATRLSDKKQELSRAMLDKSSPAPH